MAANAKQRALVAKGMLSHGQKISRGLLSGSEMKCADNTGARVLRLIQAMGYKGRLRRYPSATVGDKVTVSVRRPRFPCPVFAMVSAFSSAMTTPHEPKLVMV